MVKSAGFKEGVSVLGECRGMFKTEIIHAISLLHRRRRMFASAATLSKQCYERNHVAMLNHRPLSSAHPFCPNCHI